LRAVHFFEKRWAKHAVSEFVLIKPFAPWLKLNLLAASGEEMLGGANRGISKTEGEKEREGENGRGHGSTSLALGQSIQGKNARM
jgi:hypothetical protein